MTRLELDPLFQFNLIQWHKGAGILLLGAIALRVAVRLFSETPPLPSQLPRRERSFAKMGHAGLYALMVFMVLSGWAMVSASTLGLPTIVFGLFEWPHMPGVYPSETLESLLAEVHFFSAVTFASVIAIHIAAVIKHAQVEKIRLLERMQFQHSARYVASILVVITIVLVLSETSKPNSRINAPSDLAEIKPTQSAQLPTTATDSSLVSINGSTWVVDKSRSQVSFWGTHAGSRFDGQIGEWDTRITLPNEETSDAKLEAQFVMNTAKTGDTMYDGTLAESGWLDPDNHPKAVFISDSFKKVDESQYRAMGELSIRGKTNEQTFEVRSEPINQTEVRLTGTFTLDRLSYHIGLAADPSADWVSKDINVSFVIVAVKEK